MKKIILFTSFLISSAASFCQETKPTQSFNKDHFLKKSHNQKKVAWIMLGGGAVFILTSAIIPQGESKGLTGSWGGFAVEEFENDGIIGAFGLTGALSMLASIPVFIAAGKNKRKAASFSFKNQVTPQIRNSSLVYQLIPAVSLKINL